MEAREKIERLLIDSGLWKDERRHTHSYLLSPDLYVIDQEEKSQIENLGVALSDCLSGFGRIMAIAQEPTIGSSRTWNMIGRALNTGVPTVYREAQVHRPGSTPAFCKVDLMKSDDGRFYIAEIDGHNKHGLGYMALHFLVTQALDPSAHTLPGIVLAIVEELKRRKSEGKLTLLYSHVERFYLPEFEILATELGKHGVELTVVDEVDVVLDGLEPKSNGKPLGGLFIDLPVPQECPELTRRLAENYVRGEVDFLLPPKPFFSSKAVMALLRNDEDNKELEAILLSQIPAKSLELVRSYIPETLLVTKDREKGYWRSRIKGGSFVLKETVSSGMKGTLFQEDEKFDQALQQAEESRYRFVLQREVQNEVMGFRYYTRSGELLEGNWFSRIIVSFARRQIADVELTARMDKRVHGAKDCLQLGTIVRD